MGVTLLMILPLAPLPTASAEADCGTACRWLPLYVTLGREPAHERLLSSLIGDAMPGDPQTESMGRLLAGTHETDGLLLAKSSTFRVQLHAPGAPSHVNGTIRVLARDLGGGTIELARAHFAAPPAPRPDDGVLGALAPATQAAWSLADPLVQMAADGVETARTRPAVDLAYEGACSGSSWNSAHCRHITGRPGFGQLSPCEPAVGGPNLPAVLLRQGVGLADDAAARATGRKVVCHSYSADVNASSDAVDAELARRSVTNASAAREAWADLCDAARCDGPRNGTWPPPPHAWRDVTLDATVPAWMAQTAQTFTLPSGFRLVLDVALSGFFPSPAGGVWRPVLIEHGREDAPTSLSIRHATPGAFSAFAYEATNIAPGVHTGSLSSGFDIDSYAFEPTPASRIALAHLPGQVVRFVLHDPDGSAYHGMAGGDLEVQSSPGRWVLRVRAHHLDASTGDYAFSLAFRAPAAEDDGGRIVAGTYAGSLGPGDNSDVWTFHAWRGQRLRLHLEHAADANFDLGDLTSRFGSGGAHDVERTTAQTFETLEARSSYTGTLSFAVTRTWGSGPYTLTLDLDEGGNLSTKPFLVGMMSPMPGETLTGVVGAEDGFDVALLDFYTKATRIDRVHAFGRSTVAYDASSPYARAADGGLVHVAERSGTRRLSYTDTAHNGTPLAPLGGFAFAPDGSYVTTDRAGVVTHTSPDGTQQRFVGPEPALVPRFAPNGTLYVVSLGKGEAAYELDLSMGTFTRAPKALDGLQAFDAAGAAYRILLRDLVERYDPATGSFSIVAQAPTGTFIQRITFGGDDMLALTSSYHSAANSLAAMPYPGGFFGFSPAFAPSPLPDLAVTSIEDTLLPADGPGA
ncbi:MAG TPA: hypothetical protein VM582_06125, partial [Candidatus Thermoplasmatota archaeon]|nr:hypothetical protein [Candidatus Thermoplasmatota archaeon]